MYKEVLNFDPDHEIKHYTDEENPIDVTEIRDEIRKFKKLKKKLLENLPKSIQVSFFKV